MAMGSTGDDEGIVSEINVTPLVDVMLVLLVVFIVTAPLLTNAVTVHLPQTGTTSPADPAEPVVVSVDASNKIYVGRNEVPIGDVEERLRALHARNADVVVHLNADESCNYGIVARVMASVDRAGIRSLSVLGAER